MINVFVKFREKIMDLGLLYEIFLLQLYGISDGNFQSDEGFEFVCWL